MRPSQAEDPGHFRAPQNPSASAIPAAWTLLTLPPFKTDVFSSCRFQDQVTCFPNLIYSDRDLRLVKSNCSQWANLAPVQSKGFPGD